MQDGCVYTAWVCAYSMEWMHILMRSSRVHWLKTVTRISFEWNSASVLY